MLCDVLSMKTLQNIIPCHNKYLKNKVHIKLCLNIYNVFNFGQISMKFSKKKCMVLCMELNKTDDRLRQRGGRRGQ